MTRLLDTEYFANHIVIVERIKNDVNGNPRYYATVIVKTNPEGKDTLIYSQSPRFLIKSYGTERQVAEQAIELYEQHKY